MEGAEQNRPDPSRAGAVDISRTRKWVREPTDDNVFIGNEQGRSLRLARCLCIVGDYAASSVSGVVASGCVVSASTASGTVSGSAVSSVSLAVVALITAMRSTSRL